MHSHRCLKYNKVKIQYAYNEKELEKILAELPAQPKPGIQRYRFRRNESTQLWETTMDPEVRSLLQVSLQDAIEADETFEILMGIK